MLRENILEHLFIGEVLRHLWARKVYDAELLRSEFDAGGFDLVLCHGNIVRHIQLKALVKGGRRRHFDISRKLADRPAGCVVCAVITEDLEFDHFRWFGSEAGPLPPIDDFPITKHTKGDADGTKKERPEHRRVPLSKFGHVASLEGLLEWLLPDC